MQKVLAAQSLFGYPLRMTNTATDTATAAAFEFANYCGESVIVLEVEHTEYGTLAFIQFEDGREDQVPITTLNFLN